MRIDFPAALKTRLLSPFLSGCCLFHIFTISILSVTLAILLKYWSDHTYH